MKYHFKVHKEGKYFWAQCIEFEGCITQAKDMEELDCNMQEALNLYIQEPDDSKDLAALPDESIKKSKNIVEVALDPEVAFSFMVRYYRIKHGMTHWPLDSSKELLTTSCLPLKTRIIGQVANIQLFDCFLSKYRF